MASKRRLVRKATSNEKADVEVSKQQVHIPPGALGQLVAAKKRQMSSKIGSTKPVEYLLRSSPRHKKSLRSYATPLKIVIESPTVESRRSQHLLSSREPTPEDLSDENVPGQDMPSPEDFIVVKHSRAKRSLSRIIDDDSEEDVDIPPQLVQPISPASNPTSPTGNTSFPATTTRGVHGKTKSPTANIMGSQGNAGSFVVSTREIQGNTGSPTPNTRGVQGNTGSPAANTRAKTQAIQNESSRACLMEDSADGDTNKDKGTKRKRGPTKVKGLALQTDGPITVRFNSLGQSVGEGSVSLSSFVGPLVREIVPYTISDWRKVPTEMKDVLWATIKVRLD